VLRYVVKAIAVAQENSYIVYCLSTICGVSWLHAKLDVFIDSKQWTRLFGRARNIILLSALFSLLAVLKIESTTGRSDSSFSGRNYTTQHMDGLLLV